MCATLFLCVKTSSDKVVAEPFPYLKDIGDKQHFNLIFSPKVTHPFNKADFDVLMHQSQELAKKFNYRVPSRLHALQQAIDEVRTLPLTRPRVAQKRICC